MHSLHKALFLAIAKTLLGSSISLGALVSSNWKNAVSGNWTDGTKWSTNPTYPNNNPDTDTNYSVLINAAGSKYAITSSTDLNLDSLTIDSANASLTHTLGTIKANTIAVNNGSLLLNGGTILGGTIQAGASNTSILSGSLDGITVSSGNLRVEDKGTVNIKNGLNLSGGKLVISSNTGLTTATFDITTPSVDNMTITMDSSGSSSSMGIIAGGSGPSGLVDFTIGSNATIHCAGGSNSSLTVGAAGCRYINNGTIFLGDAYNPSLLIANLVNNSLVQCTGATLGSSLTLSGSTFDNNGTMQFDDNTALTINAINWVNNGSISMGSKSSLTLNGTFNNQSLANIILPTTGTIRFQGTLQNTGNQFVYGSLTDRWTSTIQSTISGGTVVLSSSHIIKFITYDGVLLTGDNVTVPTNVIIKNNLKSNNLRLANTGSFTFQGGDQSIDATEIIGSGTITIGTASAANKLTINTGSSIHGSMTISSGSNTLASTLINKGYIGADTPNGTLKLNTTSKLKLENYGLIEAKSGATLDLTTTTLTNFGEIRLSGGTIKLPSTGFNSGAGLISGNGSITGNLVINDPAAILDFTLGGIAQSSQYDFMSVTGNVTLGGQLSVTLTDALKSSITPTNVFELLKVDNTHLLSGSFYNVASNSRVLTSDLSGSFLVTYDTGNHIVLSDYQSLPEPALAGIAALTLPLLRRNRTAKN